jgi:hypothetical protein
MIQESWLDKSKGVTYTAHPAAYDSERKAFAAYDSTPRSPITGGGGHARVGGVANGYTNTRSELRSEMEALLA